MTESRKRVYVGPPLKRALDARPKQEASDVVNTLIARYFELIDRANPVHQHDDAQTALTLVAKWVHVVNRGLPPSNYEEVMLVPARIELMMGRNAEGCEAIAFLKSLTFDQMVSVLDKAEGMAS